MTRKGDLAAIVDRAFGEFTTADEVAEFLRTDGVYGSRNNGATNPVAKYLVNEGATTLLWIWDTGAHYLDESRRAHDYPLPTCVQSFISAFNEGQYPELIRDDGTDDDSDEDE